MSTLTAKFRKHSIASLYIHEKNYHTKSRVNWKSLDNFIGFLSFWNLRSLTSAKTSHQLNFQLSKFVLSFLQIEF